MSNLPSVKVYIQTEETQFRSAVSESYAQNSGSAINYLNDVTDSHTADLAFQQAEIDALAARAYTKYFYTPTDIEYGTGNRTLLTFNVTMGAQDIMILQFKGINPSSNLSLQMNNSFRFDSVLGTHTIEFKRGGSTLLSQTISGSGVPNVQAYDSTFFFFDQPGAGTYNYTLQSTTTDPGTGFNHIKAYSMALMTWVKSA